MTADVLSFHMIIVWINLIFVSTATMFSVIAARKGAKSDRFVFAAIAVIGLIYVLGYLWLLKDFPNNTETWSLTFRGVSLVAWPVVWWLPAMRAIKRGQAEVERERELLDALNKGMIEKEGD